MGSKPFGYMAPLHYCMQILPVISKGHLVADLVLLIQLHCLGDVDR
jgi:hypothetical protein